jgi:hypothetical protein
MAGAAAVVTLLATQAGLAFCRARSCNRNVAAAACQIDAHNCVVSGHQLFWPSICLKIGINEAGSVRHGISFEQLRDATEAAFQTWANADCTPGKPSLRVEVAGPIPCGESEYNEDAGNVNLVVFRDDTWPYVGGVDVLGTTFVRFNTNTGQIFDADIEINGTEGTISVNGSSEIDLQSLLTHEAGHVLGLDHSDLLGATMIAGYSAKDISLRTLEFDDVEGICAIFPPGAESSGSCEPPGGFSDQCGGFIEPLPEPEPAPPVDDEGCGIARPTARRSAVSIGGVLAAALFGLARHWRKTRSREVG